MAFYKVNRKNIQKTIEHIRAYMEYPKATCFFIDIDFGNEIEVERKNGQWFDKNGNCMTVESILAAVATWLDIDPYAQYYIEEIPSKWCKGEIQEFMTELREKKWLLDYKGFIMTADDHDSVTVEHTPQNMCTWRVNGYPVEDTEILGIVQDLLEQEVYWKVTEL